MGEAPHHLIALLILYHWWTTPNVGVSTIFDIFIFTKGVSVRPWASLPVPARDIARTSLPCPIMGRR